MYWGNELICSGMVICSIDWHWEKQFLPNDVSVDGRSMTRRLWQHSKIWSGKWVIDDGILIYVSVEHPMNALFWISVTVNGMNSDRRFEQYSKQFSFSKRSDCDGNWMSMMLSQFEKQNDSICLICEGTVIDVKRLQLEKHDFPMYVTEWGSLIDVKE